MFFCEDYFLGLKPGENVVKRLISLFSPLILYSPRWTQVRPLWTNFLSRKKISHTERTSLVAFSLALNLVLPSSREYTFVGNFIFLSFFMFFSFNVPSHSLLRIFFRLVVCRRVLRQRFSLCIEEGGARMQNLFLPKHSCYLYFIKKEEWKSVSFHLKFHFVN